MTAGRRRVVWPPGGVEDDRWAEKGCLTARRGGWWPLGWEGWVSPQAGGGRGWVLDESYGGWLTAGRRGGSGLWVRISVKQALRAEKLRRGILYDAFWRVMQTTMMRGKTLKKHSVDVWRVTCRKTTWSGDAWRVVKNMTLYTAKKHNLTVQILRALDKQNKYLGLKTKQSHILSVQISSSNSPKT